MGRDVFDDGVFTQTLEEKVQHGIIFDASQLKQKQTAKKKAQAKQAAKADARARALETLQNNFKTTQNNTIVAICGEYYNSWKKRLKKAKELKDSQADSKAIEAAEETIKTEENKAISEILDGTWYSDGYREFLKDYNKTVSDNSKVGGFNSLYKLGDGLNRPDLVKDIDAEVNYVKTQAQTEFAKKQEEYSKLQNQSFKTKTVSGFNKQVAMDIAHQKLAEVPAQIEDVVDQIQDVLNALLGKITIPAFDPNDLNFDLMALIGQITTLVNPVLAVTKPLEAVVPPLPLLGDVSTIIGMLSSAESGGSGDMSKEEIKKKLQELYGGNKPELDPQLLDKFKLLGQDLIAIMATFPLILVNLIFQMINVIYSKLKIITSVIPLGGFFPLSLIDAAIEAGPLLYDLMKQLPTYLYNSVVGLVKDKIAQVMVLANTIPELPDGVPSLPSVEPEQNTNTVNTSKPKTYKSLMEDFYQKLYYDGYVKTQLNKILKNYKKIHSNTNEVLKKYEDNGKDYSYGVSSGSLISYSTVGAAARDDDSKIERGYTDTKTITRGKPSVEDFEKYLDVIYNAKGDKDYIKYDRIYDVETLIGSNFYEQYKEQIKQGGIGPQIILEDKIYCSEYRKKQRQCEKEYREKAFKAERDRLVNELAKKSAEERANQEKENKSSETSNNQG